MRICQSGRGKYKRMADEKYARQVQGNHVQSDESPVPIACLHRLRPLRSTQMVREGYALSGEIAVRGLVSGWAVCPSSSGESGLARINTNNRHKQQIQTTFATYSQPFIIISLLYHFFVIPSRFIPLLPQCGTHTMHRNQPKNLAIRGRGPQPIITPAVSPIGPVDPALIRTTFNNERASTQDHTDIIEGNAPANVIDPTPANMIDSTLAPAIVIEPTLNSTAVMIQPTLASNNMIEPTLTSTDVMIDPTLTLNAVMIQPTLASDDMIEPNPDVNLAETAAQAMSAPVGGGAAWTALQYRIPFGCRIAISSGPYDHRMQGQEEGDKSAHSDALLAQLKKAASGLGVDSGELSTLHLWGTGWISDVAGNHRMHWVLIDGDMTAKTIVYGLRGICNSIKMRPTHNLRGGVNVVLKVNKYEAPTSAPFFSSSTESDHDLAASRPWVVYDEGSHWEVAYAFDGDYAQSVLAWAAMKDSITFPYVSQEFRSFRGTPRMTLADFTITSTATVGPGSLPIRPPASTSCKRTASDVGLSAPWPKRVATNLAVCLKASDEADEAVKEAIAKAVLAHEATQGELTAKLAQLRAFGK